MRNHGFGDKVGVETDINNFRGLAAKASAGIRIFAGLYVSSRAASDWAGRLRWGSENFTKLDQFGIVAQKFYVCGNLRRRFFLVWKIQNLKKLSVKCRVYNCREGCAAWSEIGRASCRERVE